jgi:hypothetical protein
VHFVRPTRQHGGPRSGFFCEEHQKLSESAKNKIKADRKAAAAKGASSSGRGKAAKASGSGPKKGKRKLSAEARKRIADAVKASWVKRKKAAKKD